MSLPSRLFLFLLFVMLGLAGCDEREGLVFTSERSGINSVAGGTTGTGGTTGGTGGSSGLALNEITAQIALPSGSTLDFSNTFLLSSAISYPVSQSGQSKVALDQGDRIFAALFDQNNKPLLIGFVTEQGSEISVATTVEATVFLGLDLYNMPIEVQNLFWANARSFPNFQSIVSQAEALFKSDPNFFGGTAYRDLMTNYLKFLDNGGVSPRMEILNNNERSGLMLDEQPGDKAVIVNTARRRCHAFLYKMKSTNDTGQETVLINNIVADKATAVRDLTVGTVSAYDSLIGTAQGGASGKGIEFFRKESDPLDLSLTPSEKEAHWKVRVIGLSTTEPDGLLTDAEAERYRRLTLETVALDAVLPFLFKLASADDFLADLDDDPELKQIAEDMITILGQVGGVNDAINEKKSIKEIFQSFKESLSDAFVGATFKPLFNRIVTYIAVKKGLKGAELSAFKELASKTELYLEVTDAILEINKYRELISGIVFSEPLEEFDVVVTKGKVSLAPQTGVAIQGEAEDFTATVHDANLDGAVFQYTWSTSGQYGELRDSLGNSGKSFTTPSKSVEYFSSNTVALPSGSEAVDVIQVKVEQKQGAVLTEIGTKSASVTVREIGFQITPRNSELEGGDSLEFSVVDDDFTNPISSQNFDYKIVWDTQGHFGLFNNVSHTVTSTSSNTATYNCLEEEKEGTEEISAYVYCRPKNSSESYKLVKKLTTTIEIINDPEIKIFYVNRFTRYKKLENNDLGRTRYIVRHSFAIEMVKDAIDYSVEIVTWNDPYSHYLGRRGSWDADNTSLLDDGTFEPKNPNHFIFEPSTGSSVLGDERGQMQIAGYDTVTGLAKVKVRVRP